MTDKLISVLVTTFNRDKYICDCIDSILNQTYKNIEIVVVDDGSTDSTKQKLKNYSNHIKYLYQSNSGISAARNRCINEANGELVAFIDSDDIWLPNKLEEQVYYLNNHINSSIVFSKYKNFIDNADINSPEIIKENETVLRTSMVTALIKKDLFNKFGLFSTELENGEDSEWVFRITLNGVDTSHFIDKTLYLRRLHSSNSILNKKASNLDVYKVLGKTIRNKILERKD